MTAEEILERLLGDLYELAGDGEQCPRPGAQCPRCDLLDQVYDLAANADHEMERARLGIVRRA